MPLFLTEADVRSALSLQELIPAMEGALVAFSEGRTQQPLRTVIEVGTGRAYYGVMPAYRPDTPALGTKIVTAFTGNADRGLPTHLATILLFDHVTGALSAVMDGRYLTEVRTAAVSAVSVRYLARPDARTLGILGSGVQARSHLEAFAFVHRVERVRVYSPNVERRTRFAGDMAERMRVEIEAVASAEAAVREAGIVLIASTAPVPVLFADWIADGTHVVSIGASRPDQREMDPRLVARARVIVDSRTGALAEAGDLVMGIAEGHFDERHVAGELGEVAGGRLAGRTAADQTTLFKSLGMAVEDVTAAELALQRAVARGLGRHVDV